MPSRRPLLRRAVALVTAGTALGSTVAPVSGSRSNADGSDSTTAAPSSSGRRSADRRVGPIVPYDASTVADADTVVTAVADPSVVSSTGLPAPWAERLLTSQRDADGVSVGNATAITGSVAINDDDALEGAVVARGTFDADAVVSAIEANGETAPTRPTDETRRLRGTDEPFAAAVSDATVIVGYGGTADRAVEHVNAALDRGGRRERVEADYGSLPSLLAGDAVVYADLGPAGRARTRSRLSAAPRVPDTLRTAVETASAVGAAIRVADGRRASIAGKSAGSAGSGETDDASIALRYGAVADPRRLTRQRVERLAAEATNGEPSLADATVRRRGRTLVVDAAADDDALFAAHADLVGAAVEDTRDIHVG